MLSYNPIGGQTAFDNEETMLPTYWSTSFEQLCVGMKAGGSTKFVTIDHNASSLYSLIADGKHRPTNIGREKWMSLVVDSSLQIDCNKEGFNVIGRWHKTAKFRLGIAGNEKKECDSPDSFLGFGGNIIRMECIRNFSLWNDYNICGNFAGCSADNGDKFVKAKGYILVR